MPDTPASHTRAATARSTHRRSWRGFLLLGLVPLGLPAATAVRAKPHGHEAVAVLAGGCYWGVESVFDHVRGVTATSGYAYPVSEPGGTTGRAEAVRLVYDPSRITYQQILEVFFTVVHDPTQLNRQGPDEGTDYRSVIFVQGDSERAVARHFVDSLAAAHVYPRPIVTRIDVLKSFEPVGPDQQHFAEKNPDNPYIVYNDAPKLVALQRRFPSLYHG